MTHTFFEEWVKETLLATSSANVLEAIKELVEELLLPLKKTPMKTFNLKELVHILGKCKYMGFQSV